jgi:hypothetical protein
VASLSGGAIFTGEYSIAQWKQLRCAGNKALAGDGGCCYGSDNSYNIINTGQILGNFAQNGGGGLAGEQNSRMSLSSCDLEGNKANTGGAYFVALSAGMEDVNSTIRGNTALLQGGGIALLGQNVLILNADICDNTATFGGGVAVRYGQSISVSLQNCVIRWVFI